MAKKKMSKKTAIIITISLLLILIVSLVIISLTKKPTEDIDKTFCPEESRNAEFCIEIYQPVCGYDSNHNQIQTFSNSCFACMNENVEYYIDGQCI